MAKQQKISDCRVHIFAETCLHHNISIDALKCSLKPLSPSLLKVGAYPLSRGRDHITGTVNDCFCHVIQFFGKRYSIHVKNRPFCLQNAGFLTKITHLGVVILPLNFSLGGIVQSVGGQCCSQMSNFPCEDTNHMIITILLLIHMKICM